MSVETTSPFPDFVGEYEAVVLAARRVADPSRNPHLLNHDIEVLRDNIKRLEDDLAACQTDEQIDQRLGFAGYATEDGFRMVERTAEWHRVRPHVITSQCHDQCQDNKIRDTMIRLFGAWTEADEETWRASRSHTSEGEPGLASQPLVLAEALRDHDAGYEWAIELVGDRSRSDDFYRGAASYLVWLSNRTRRRAPRTTAPAPMAYCVSCKAKVEMAEPVQVAMKNGKPATQGLCPTCGGKIFRIGAI